MTRLFSGMILAALILPLTGGHAGAAQTPPPPDPPPSAPNPEAAAQSWTVGVVKEGGEERLEFRQADSQTVCVCAGTTFKVPGGMSLRLAAVKGQVRLRGPSLRASADRLSFRGPPPSLLALEGHVQLTDDRDGRHVSILGGRVVLDLTNGHWTVGSAEENVGQGQAETPARATGSALCVLALLVPLPPGLLGLWGLPDLTPTSPAPLERGDSCYYSRESAFLIPFRIDPSQHVIQKVLLHVSEDFGKTYQRVAEAPPEAAPGDRWFPFQARHDGWYWFTVQTQNQEGHYCPPNLTLAPPGLKVCVDTQAPVVTLKAAPPHEGTVAVEWDIREENLDLLSLCLDYRAAGSQDWTPVTVPPVAHGQQGWNPVVQGPLEVRLRVQDKAQNQAEAVATVTSGTVRKQSPPDPPCANVTYVKGRTFDLNYTTEDEGPSGVKNVEVWVTRDTRSWQRHAADARRQGPFTVTVAGEGRYGFTLIPRSGVGLADKPPKLGDQPQVWVEVDETRPVVHLSNVVVGRGSEAGKLTVYWTASDRFLRAQPITISYATKADGPWTPLATRLANTGSYSRDSQDLPFQFYVKVEAVDEADNVGSARTRETVKVDLKIPRIKGIKVTARDPQAAREK